MKAGDVDQAVAYFKKASGDSPDNPNYKIALQRAMLAASRAHFDKAREFEEKGELEAARGEYQLASEYDPSNRQAAAKVTTLDQTIRARIEAQRPRPAIEQLRERARAATTETLLNPASRDPIKMTFRQTNVRDVLDFLGSAGGITVVYDPSVPQTAVNAVINEPFEQALQQILAVNQLAYKVLNERSILIFPDNAQKHAQYDEQVLQTFYVSHADVAELTQLLNALVRVPTMGVQPAIQFNKAANTITVRATAQVVQLIERIIAQNDKARAEIVFDVEILEVNRERAKQYGLNLTEYALGGILSPEVSPNGTTTTTTENGSTTTASSKSQIPTGVASPPAFNLNTISRGFNTTDFYLAVPAAIVKFLESDTNTKVIAKPQLRGAEGNKITVNLGEEIPIVTTSYTPIATGGAGVNPLNSFQYRSVGINVDITPLRVTLEGDILLDLIVESSSRGADVSIGGTSYPSFGSRKVNARLRLRDGESNLLAGLLREDERKALSGFPGAINVPVLRQLFSSNDQTIRQTDIVMLLTPHVVRAPEITQADLQPVFLGAQNNMAVGGPPPLIGQTAGDTLAGAAPLVTPGAPGRRTQAAQPGPGLALPPGSSPVPGFITPSPAAPAPQTALPTAPPAAAPAPAPATPPPPAPPAPVQPVQPTGPIQQPAPTPPVDVPPPSPGLGTALVLLNTPMTPLRVGGGPYNVPISITNVARLSTISLTLTFDPMLLRPRAVTEGGFMRSGGSNATFTNQVGQGRIDVTIVRSADSTGATGTGLLFSVLFDAVAAGTAGLGISGTGTGPGGTPMGLQFRPAVITVQP
jgi:type II secretory pathway component GspD/PulD (secretin)